MTTVKQIDIERAVKELGIGQGDIVLIHSSFKSMGYVEGGAEAVVSGFLDVIGSEGTLVFPTLCQKDFEHSYETWHLDKESDVGYLTNYFRKRKGSIRSDQATHSVAACGKYASYLTETHGHTHKRIGVYGETPFSADSPWEKMYQMDAKVALLGVDARYTTFRHYAEYVYVEECLNSIKDHPDYTGMENRISRMNRKGVWPSVHNMWIWEQLDKMGAVSYSCCGDAQLTCYSAKDFVDFALCMLRQENDAVLRLANPIDWVAWRSECKKIREECNGH